MNKEQQFEQDYKDYVNRRRLTLLPMSPQQ